MSGEARIGLAALGAVIACSVGGYVLGGHVATESAAETCEASGHAATMAILELLGARTAVTEDDDLAELEHLTRASEYVREYEALQTACVDALDWPTH